ncbi:DNA damage-responsive transcriptional repressor-like protein [Emericellopsis cladophorae]|uniref:[histone H3]-trimethyl-L-lysine(9) demethylase n=1 Tax=Emericellopsis cladophorae TaxID=2686198 RepID=A0A9P9Y0I5_9HYPO|nr:DNA damage-responsive transcriptional repressor-like protein [Emericellopsis cladophorae]KAI6780855.1 DNA damage-responsive transcriptional repressor-like protein [Emericellopsis cladophorae]
MSTEALGVLSAAAAAAQSAGKAEQGASPAFLHSPPDSNNAAKSEGSDSELSDLDEEPVLPGPPLTAPSQAPQFSTTEFPPVHEPPAESDAPVEDDIGEVLPADWSGNVAIFKPTMHQFKDFDKFMAKVNSYGMKSGIIKIVPPKEWLDEQPPLDEMVKTLRVREPIKQDIMGSNGTYRQVNILHGRSYNVPGWKKLCEQSEHQPPARRGERRANADKPKPRRSAAAAPVPKPQEPPRPKKRGRKPKRGGRAGGRGGRSARAQEDRPMTPVSPKAEEDESMETIEHDQPEMGFATRGGKAKTQSVSARRKYQKREGSAMIDEAAFKDFDYKMDISDYTPERCEELERAYWKTLTYAPPLYGADMMGTLFDDRTEAWNLNKLPNLLDVLGTKIPGVNTAYLYFGMWKATFAWHLEDVDLYSINYVHFGAPKQWYSISQADARRFENAMKSIWPADAKACNQFLRHKGFLISPQHLLQNYNIKVNKVVSYPGEFVVTFPYGYHSGYNLGYNCAEAVNFALEPWLEMGKIAKRCECAQAQDSVWINVYEIERKLRGEETDYEETDEDEDDEEDEEEDDTGIHSPHGQVKIKVATRKRKRQAGEKAGEPKVKKIKLRLKRQAEPPCCLCPNDISAMELLPTDDGRKAHRVCALYLPETYIDTVDDHEIVSNVSGIHKDRTELKCLYCRSKRGACFQCSQKKCARAYHPTCAAAAGVFIEEEDVPVFGDDGVEYKEQAFEFSCRFHRTKRDKKRDGEALENDERIREHAAKLNKGDVCQLQYFRGEVFAGIVVENRADEQMLLVDILPSGDRLEIEWKWLAVADPADYHLPKASPNALPLPPSQKAKDKLNAKRSEDERPRKDDVFAPGYAWAEFNHHVLDRNPEQVKVDLSKDNQLWYFIGKGSTDTKAQYTEDPRRQCHNAKANFLDTLPKPPKPVKAVPNPTVRRQSYNTNPGFIYAPGMSTTHNTPQAAAKKEPKPYQYKPKTQMSYGYPAPQAPTYTAQQFAPSTQPHASRPINNSYNYYLPPGSQSGQQGNQAYTQTPAYSQQQLEVKPHRTPMNYHNPKQPYQAPAAQQHSSPSWGQPSQQNSYQQTPQYPQHPPQDYSQSSVPRPTSSVSPPSMSGSPAAHQPAAFSPPAPSHSPAALPPQRTMSTPSSTSAVPKTAQAPAATPTSPPVAAKPIQQRPQLTTTGAIETLQHDICIAADYGSQAYTADECSWSFTTSCRRNNFETTCGSQSGEEALVYEEAAAPHAQYRVSAAHASDGRH